jgi:hypothetical protein
MGKFSFMVIAPLVLVTSATWSGPAAAINARQALAGVGSGDDSVTHDGGGVSICKGGSFPGCQGGKSFYCPPGGKPCEQTKQARKPKTGVTGAVPGGGILDSGPSLNPRGPTATGAPAGGGATRGGGGQIR